MAESLTIEIINKRGLHARATAKFVKVVASFDAQVEVLKLGGDDSPVHGGSILGLMMLGADPGSRLTITAEGPQAGEVLAALKELIDNKFGEGE